MGLAWATIPPHCRPRWRNASFDVHPVELAYAEVDQRLWMAEYRVQAECGCHALTVSWLIAERMEGLFEYSSVHNVSG